MLGSLLWLCFLRFSTVKFHHWVSITCLTSGPVFCLLLGVSSDYAQPITGQVTEVTCPVIGRAQPELTPSKRQKTGPEVWGTDLPYCFTLLHDAPCMALCFPVLTLNGAECTMHKMADTPRMVNRKDATLRDAHRLKNVLLLMASWSRLLWADGVVSPQGTAPGLPLHWLVETVRQLLKPMYHLYLQKVGVDGMVPLNVNP